MGKYLLQLVAETLTVVVAFQELKKKGSICTWKATACKWGCQEFAEIQKPQQVPRQLCTEPSVNGTFESHNMYKYQPH